MSRGSPRPLRSPIAGVPRLRSQPGEHPPPLCSLFPGAAGLGDGEGVGWWGEGARTSGRRNGGKGARVPWNQVSPLSWWPLPKPGERAPVAPLPAPWPSARPGPGGRCKVFASRRRRPGGSGRTRTSTHIHARSHTHTRARTSCDAPPRALLWSWGGYVCTGRGVRSLLSRPQLYLDLSIIGWAALGCLACNFAEILGEDRLGLLKRGEPREEAGEWDFLPPLPTFPSIPLPSLLVFWLQRYCIVMSIRRMGV